MKKSVSLCALVALVAVLGGRPAWGAPPSGSTLLVIPARYTVVQFAFDVARLRSVYLVSYDRPATATETVLFAWDNTKAEWLPIDAADIRSGSLFHVKPARTVLVGDTSILPPELADVAQGEADPTHIASLNLADMANSLNKVLHFRSREWKWLADRYDFELTDTNYERRRWGRYGPPGDESREARERQAPMPSALDAEMDVLEPMSVAPAPAVPMPTSRQTIVIPVAAPTPAPAAAADDGVAVPALETGSVPAAAKPLVPRPEDK